MKKDIILAGVGGQGILSIAASIGMAAVNDGLFLKQAEVHGMSQRGGDVHSNLRIADKEVASDLIPEGHADMILSVEPMESLRYLPMLASDGWLITNSNPYKNIPNYPEIDDVLEEIKKVKNHVIIDANKIALDLGTKKAANIVILGAAAPFIGLAYSSLENAISNIFKRKGKEVVELNLSALKHGFDFAKKFIKN
ncbi:MAG: indolepyruvate oxidoreductase subunit beta [Bacteroidales bacterium]|nr:indolepyruvate oxidoreductase subunit beta [Bacteroidales bacterium]